MTILFEIRRLLNTLHRFNGSSGLFMSYCVAFVMNPWVLVKFVILHQINGQVSRE